MYIALHVKYPLFLSDFNETWIFSSFEKSSNINFQENTSSGSRVVPCGRTHMTKLKVAFRYFANAPKKEHFYHTVTTLPPVNGYMSLAADTSTRINAVHIRLIISLSLLMRMVDKTGASLFLPIRNGTAHRHICRRWRTKWILRINTWGGEKHLICRP